MSGPRLGPNAHDDLKTTLSKIDIDDGATPPNTTPTSKYPPPRWDLSQPTNHHRHERLGSKLDLKYPTGGSSNALNNESSNNVVGESPRNSREIESDNVVEQLSPRMLQERYSRSPGKQPTPNKPYIETKTDYGKYR